MNNETPASHPRGRHPLMLTAALTVPLLAVGACGTGGGTAAPGASARPGQSTVGSGTSGGTSGTPAPSGTAGPTTTAPSGSGSPRQISTSVYFLNGEHMSPAPRTVPAPATATGAVRALLAGPSRYERLHHRTTAIPSGTALHSIAVHDHVATVDLSSRYDDGGGTLSLRARLAQVVFTVTRYPSIDKVRFELDGKPVSSFGGEGIVLNEPVGRADFEDVSPAVLVESPLIGDGVSSPLRVRGSADTFEAEFRLKLTDTSGHTAADVLVRATSGTGTRGTFDVSFPYKAARSGPGLLTAYYVSPKNGRPVTVDTVPLTVNR
ncbi:GerMN domain-containing protein [Streptomyces sp. HUAS TT20]|uniref:GerMN domain-containing protein n=1 Tax=Streptomyces sp. HUAS TT20 TaxID=3447509 RepID=UPI0021D8FA24|nr:GerMN domain-containing protein [Streptomyces sp. HUAS 15-9]UXY31748.1 GerMN domain-containing protein [Streptomyces sp. HUAS 15-9]